MSRGGRSAGFEECNNFADLGDLAFLLQEFGESAGVGGGEFDGGLFALERDERFVAAGRLAGLFEPIANFDFGDGFTEFGDA